MLAPNDVPPSLYDALLLLPADASFTTAEAQARGVDSNLRARLVVAGLLRRPVRGVYWPPGIQDTLDARLRTLRLVVPADCVVTDRTAAWLWGAEMVLAPGSHLEPPRVSVFAPPGRRLRNGFTQSGERSLAASDVVELDGLLVTTPLRTACDVARLLRRDQALGVLDMLARADLVDPVRLVVEIARFKRYRGVIQARALVTLVDAGAQSPMESVLRLRWLDAGLPRPDCQAPVPAPDGGWFYVDIGLPEDRFGAEYLGAEFHGDGEAAHDEERLDWITGPRDWVVEVFRRDHVFGQQQDAIGRLQRAWHVHLASTRQK